MNQICSKLLTKHGYNVTLMGENGWVNIDTGVWMESAEREKSFGATV